MRAAAVGSAVRGPVAARRHAESPLELARQMALVGEPGAGGDRRERLVGTHQPPRDPLQPEAAAVLADALAESGPEGSSQVRGVQADLAGDPRQRWRRPGLLRED